MRSEVHVTDEVVTVYLRTTDYPFISATGWAKKHPKDEPNPAIGIALATKRALDLMAKQAERELAYATTGGVPRTDEPLPF